MWLVRMWYARLVDRGSRSSVAGSAFPFPLGSKQPAQALLDATDLIYSELNHSSSRLSPT